MSLTQWTPMFKPTLVKNSESDTHRIEYHLADTVKPPASIEVPKWLVEHLTYMIILQSRADRVFDKAKCMKFIRNVMPGVGLKEAKDIVESIYESEFIWMQM